MNIESITIANLDVNEDIVDVALREAVRLGLVIRTKDEQGRDVFTAAPKN